MNVELKPHHRKVAGATIPEALEYAAATWPDNPAVHIVETGERLTWAQVHDAVGRLRSALEARGLRPGDKVGLMLRNQLEFPLAWLAVIEAGAVVVPLNPRYTRREVDFVTGDVEASWLIVADDLTELVAGVVAPEHLVTARDVAELRTHPRRARTHLGAREEVVGIQFTSGTTGLPKGCVHTHEYWILMGAYGAAHQGDPRSILADHPFYYMQNQFYLMTALACGGQIHVTPGLSRAKFMRWLIDYEIDFAWIDEGMLDVPPSPDDRRLTLKKAPVDALPPALHKALEERFGLVARECYGSTEAGAGVQVPWERTDTVGTGSMGWCHPLRESKVIDASGAETPPGEPGELCLRGPGMMLGYHNRPEVNAELFLPGGWFRTGDIVRKTADGEHFYLGRVRDMIRRSGENIAAAEVELHLMGLAGVVEVGVIPVPDAMRGEEVKAVIVRDGALTVAEIMDWCRAGLAPFKVPRYLEFRDELPHTSSGKIAKSVLRSEDPLSGEVIDTSVGGPGSRGQDAVVPDSETIFSWVADLARHTGRGTGGPGDDRSVDYLIGKFREFQLTDVHVRETDSFSWRAARTGLVVGSVPIPHSAAAYSFETGPGPFSTGPSGLSAPLVDVGDGDFAHRDVEGKIVLFDLRFTLPRRGLLDLGEFFYDPHDTVAAADLQTANPYLTNYADVLQRAIAGGAAGFVGVLSDYFDSHDFHPEYTPGITIPGLWVTRAEGRRIRSLTPDANLRLDGEWAPATARTLIGFLPGRSTDTIMIQSHHDSAWHGAVEDATGTACVLALADYYRQIPREARPKTLMFVLMDSHWTGYQAHQDFVDTYVGSAASRRIVANVTLEHIAKQAEVGPDGQLVVLDKPEYRAVFENVSAPLKAVIEAAVARNDLQRTLRIPTDQLFPLLGELPTDADAVYQAGVPTISFISAPIYLYDKADTLDKVLKRDLAPVARSFIEIIDALSTTPSDQIPTR